MEETALVRAEDDREEGCDVFANVLFRVEDEEVRGGCEVENSLGFGASLAAASARSFSKPFTFRVSESTWKLSFLRSLSTLAVTDGKNEPEIRNHHHLHQVFVVSPLDFDTLLLQVFLHLIASFLQLLKACVQTGFLAKCVKLALQSRHSLFVLSVLQRELELRPKGLLFQRSMILL